MRRSARTRSPSSAAPVGLCARGVTISAAMPWSNAASSALGVNTPDAKTSAAFRAEADRLVATMRGTLVPADVYDAAVKERDTYRKSGGK
jgi:hypothetical protein